MSSSSVNVESQQQQQQQRRWYLLMDNPSKTNHIGTLLRCAAAFQCHQVLLVGYDKFNWQGSFGSHLFLDIVVFPTWDSVHEYLMRGGDDDDDCANDASSNDTTTSTNGISANNNEPRKPITIMGILGAYGGGDEIFSTDGLPVYTNENSYASIVPPRDNVGYTHTANNRNVDRKQCTTAKCSQHHSFPIEKRPFSSDTTCFILSKDRNGLPTSQAQLCSGFVHVPHLSFDSNEVPATCMESTTATQPNASASAITQSNLMDTATTLSIVLHHYTAWAEYNERTFEENQKFTKDIKPNARRRLCRVYGQDKQQQKHGLRNRDNDKTAEGNSDNEQGAMTLLFNEETDNTERSDY